MTTQNLDQDLTGSMLKGMAGQYGAHTEGATSTREGQSERGEEVQRARLQASKLDPEFIDIDPCLKSLKGGYLMQRTFFNTKVGSAAHSTQMTGSPLKKRSPTRLLASTIDVGSRAADLTTDAQSSGTALMRTTRFGAKGAIGFGKAGAGPACNYQNVDLFKIPDGVNLGPKQRRQRSQRMSQIENNRTFATLQLHNDLDNRHQYNVNDSSERKSALTEIQPDQIIKDAIIEAKYNQKLRREYGTQIATSMARAQHGYTGQNNWENLRAQTEIHSVYSQSPQLQGADDSGQNTQTGFNPNPHGLSYIQNIDDYFRSPKVSDASFPAAADSQRRKDGQFNSQRQFHGQQHASQFPGTDRPPQNLNLQSTTLGFGGAETYGEDFRGVQRANINEDSQLLGHTTQRVDANQSATSFTNKEAFPGGFLQPRASARNQQSSTMRSQAIDDDQDRHRRTPILHMQFDELASHQLYNTYANKFVKKDQLQRRNPLKYMQNPSQVFGLTQGARQYTWRDPKPALRQAGQQAQMQNTLYSGSVDRRLQSDGFLGQGANSTLQSTARHAADASAAMFGGTTHQFNATKFSTIQPQNSEAGPMKGLNLNIKVHSVAQALAGGPDDSPDILEPVPQISGRGVSVSPPSERPYIINSVIKPFRATSEIDRQRATQILDYIIERRKMTTKKQEEAKESRKDVEHNALLQQIEDDIKNRNNQKKRRGSEATGNETEGSSDFDEFDKDDKYGSVLQKDLDRITGGMQVVRECKLDLDALDELIGTPEEGGGPAQGKMGFLVDQLERNEFFKGFVETWDQKIDGIMDICARESAVGREKALRSQILQPGQPPAQLPKYDLKAKIQDAMLEMSPVRKAKQQMVRNHQMERKFGNPTMIKNHQGQASLANRQIVLTVDGDPNDSFDRTLQDIQKPLTTRFKTDTSKDVFSGNNRANLEKRAAAQRQRHDSMKKYGRFLFYAGVEHLAKDDKKVYAFEKRREAEKKRAKAQAAKREKRRSPRVDSGTRQSSVSPMRQEPTRTLDDALKEVSKDDYHVQVASPLTLKSPLIATPAAIDT